jgi:hypothetical protein
MVWVRVLAKQSEERQWGSRRWRYVGRVYRWEVPAKFRAQTPLMAVHLSDLDCYMEPAMPACPKGILKC